MVETITREEFNSLKSEIDILKKKMNYDDITLSKEEKLELKECIKEYGSGKVFTLNDIEKEKKNV